MRAGPRQIWLCADDYGIAPGVNGAIRELIARERINATSVMVAAPHLGEAEAGALDLLNSGNTRAALGLHVTLTAPFTPLSPGFAPLREGSFPPLGEMMRLAIARRLQPELLAIEIATQLRAFLDAFGRPPDFLDGHQHVQLFPQVRDAFLKVMAEAAPHAWVRQCGRANSLRRLHDRKALVLDILSMAFRRRAERLGLATNTAFAGAYAFTPKANFGKIFPRFLAGLPDGGLIMCHPGLVDAELQRLDSLTTLREREFAYFNSDEFPKLLARQGVELARPAGNDGETA
ncbi:MAG: ChbG/HpnK family deacetylase [Rhizobiales bacterium]|nr:ChbG/HpnK family deacetylase [Hyphomicrobiales bacterium]